MPKSNFDNQVALWETSAKAGDARAALALGNHFHDLGDFPKAFSWYYHASQQADVNPIAFFYLGYAYQYGEGTAIDRMQALAMYQKAAEFDVPQALYSLAYFYQNGIVVSRDESMAQGYMKQATRKMDALYTSQFDTREKTAYLRAQITAEKALVDTLQQRNEAQAIENGKFNQRLDQANKEIARGVEARDKQAKEYERQLLEWKQKVQSLESQKTRMEARNQTLSTQIQEMNKQLDQVNKEIARGVEARDKQAEEYERQLLEWKQKAQFLESQKTRMEAQNQALNTQLQEMAEQQNDLWKEVDARGRSIQEREKDIEGLQQNLSSVHLELTQTHNELERVQNDAARLSKAVFRLTHRNDANMRTEYANQSVSVFEKYTFSVDGIACASLESFLESLKFKDSRTQIAVCGMAPQEARKYGYRQMRWYRSEKLWWNGKLIKRSAPEYQALLDRVFHELHKNSAFADALQNCGDLGILKETAPSPIPLTEEEFVSRLVKMRSISRKET